MSQLALDLGAEPVLPRAKRLTPARARRVSRLVTLATEAMMAEDGVARARTLLELQEELADALALAIADAHRTRSWRVLSVDLDIPFQTLHRRFAVRPPAGQS
jgi:hypothetical protein